MMRVDEWPVCGFATSDAEVSARRGFRWADGWRTVAGMGLGCGYPLSAARTGERTNHGLRRRQVSQLAKRGQVAA